MNSTSSKINVITNDDNAGNQINKTIFNLHQASPLATHSNSIENIMRERQANDRNFNLNQESESPTHLMENKSASNEPTTAYIGVKKLNPVAGSRLAPKSEMLLPDPTTSVNVLRQQILIDDPGIRDDRTNVMPNQYRETLRTNQSGVMGGKIEVMNSIDAKRGLAANGNIHRKGGTGGLPTPAASGFVIGNSKFDKYNL